MKAIEFENVGKQYRLGLVSTGTISHDLNRWWAMNVLHKEDPYLKIGETNDRSHKGHSDYVWALKDINFSIEEGDVVGIIGKNGAGKSTLLKLLSRVTAPTTGQIRARGRIASLLEVGTGFHPEMTGRENIYLNGAIMGMTKAEISRKLDEIVDFSGCERYIDTPVKRYSSGMTVRLGFAIAAHLEPEILVVDEVLAVGDAEFQKKAIGKMQDVSKGEGRTVLFVSHNMASIRSLCNHCVLMENGTVKAIGETNDICNLYLQSGVSNLGAEWEVPLTDKNFQMYRAELLDSKGISRNNFTCDEEFIIRMYFNVKERVPGVYGYLHFQRSDGIITWVMDSNDVENNKLEQLPIGKSVVEIRIPKRTMGHGQYLICLNFTSNQNAGGWDVDSPLDCLQVTISDDNTARGDRRGGYLSKILKWNINTNS